VGKKKAAPRADAHVVSSSAPAAISPETCSMLKTRCASFWTISQSQNAGQKSNP